MRILIAGSSWHHPMYETAWKSALERLGHDVVPISLSHPGRNIISKVEERYSIYGPYLSKIQSVLKNQVHQSKPDIVLIWLGHAVFPETIKTIRGEGQIRVISYIHDDPFAHRFHDLTPRYHRWFWRAFISALPHYDLALFSKQQNVDEAYQFGCRQAAILPQYFVPDIHYPRVLTEAEAHFKCDVAFAGHFEPDGRDRMINRLVEAGLTVNLYGDFTWKKARLAGGSDNFRRFPRANGDSYPLALSGASMCLCFLSKMNRDQYTTRCFEIPACGSVLVSERTSSLSEYYVEDQEAVFFSNGDELLDKVLYLRDNPLICKLIAQAGLRKVHSANHSVDNRVSELMLMIEQLNR